MILLAFLNLIFQLRIIKKANPMIVKIAGYILKAFQNSPFIKNKKERCMPQPKHSKPKKVLLKQGSN